MTTWKVGRAVYCNTLERCARKGPWVRIPHLPQRNIMSNRAESGPMQFGDDWCGVFIRGDNAMYYSMILKSLLNGEITSSDIISKMVLQGLVDELSACLGNPESADKLKDYKDCK